MQWPSLTLESMNNTWKCLLYCFVLSHYFFIRCGYPKHTFENPEHIAFKKNILYRIV